MVRIITNGVEIGNGEKNTKGKPTKECNGVKGHVRTLLRNYKLHENIPDKRHCYGFKMWEAIYTSNSDTKQYTLRKYGNTKQL